MQLQDNPSQFAVVHAEQLPCELIKWFCDKGYTIKKCPQIRLSIWEIALNPYSATLCIFRGELLTFSRWIAEEISLFEDYSLSAIKKCKLTYSLFLLNLILKNVL